MATSAMMSAEKFAKNGFGDNVPRRTAGGKFTKEESDLVRQAVHEFCAAKQISVDRLCSECEHKSELKGSWNEIAKQLPHRSVQSVYRHGLRILHPFKRGVWTEEEILKLIELVTRLGKKWVACQKALNRSADACRDKYREMSEEFIKGRWKDHETDQLSKLIRQHLRSDPNASIVEIGKMVEAEGVVIPWSTISKKMGNRSRLSCFKKFQKLCGLFSPSDTSGTNGNRVRRSQALPSQPSHSTADVAASSTIETSSAVDAPGVVPARASSRQQVEEVDDEGQRHAEPSTSSGADLDMFLLSELATSGATRTSEVPWDTLRVDEAQDRWNDLVMEWQQQEGDEATEDALLTLPFYELAQLLLDRKTSAKMAAETVEAVDLPTV